MVMTQNPNIFILDCKTESQNFQLHTDWFFSTNWYSLDFVYILQFHPSFSPSGLKIKKKKNLKYIFI